MNFETWADIKGFEGRYIISTNGNIISLRNNEYMAFTCDKDGYFQLHLSKDAIAKVFKVHRLVAETFIPNPENKPLPNHKNGLKQINHVSNLEWVTHSENTQHSYDLKLHVPLMGESHQNSKLSNAQVLEIRSIYNMGGISQCKLAKKYGLCQAAIGKIVNNINWKHI